MSLVEAARYPTRIAAEIARGRLEADGIGAVLFDQGLATLGMTLLSSVRLMVLEEDLAVARATLDAIDRA